ncbi:MAG: hypothetical protein WAV09_01775 [Minisyncoccia bacterium]
MNELKKRFLSFLWNFGWVSASLFIGFLADNLDLIGTTFEFSPTIAIVVGLILTQVSKAAKNKITK